MPLDSFYTPLKHQKNSTFQMFLGGGRGIERSHYHETGYNYSNLLLIEQYRLNSFMTEAAII